MGLGSMGLSLSLKVKGLGLIGGLELDACFVNIKPFNLMQPYRFWRLRV